MNKNLINIVGVHKSGTTLLRNLLDGNNGLFVIPFESHYFQNMEYWVDYRLRRNLNKSLSNNKVINNFINFIHERNNREEKKGGSKVKGQINEKIFKEKSPRCLPISCCIT